MLTTEDKEEIKRLLTEAAYASTSPVEAIVDVTARAIEVLGTREKALLWLKTPVRSLGEKTPLSLLDHPGGVEQVQDALGRIEHGVW